MARVVKNINKLKTGDLVLWLLDGEDDDDGNKSYLIGYFSCTGVVRDDEEEVKFSWQRSVGPYFDRHRAEKTNVTRDGKGMFWVDTDKLFVVKDVREARKLLLLEVA
jgi:hypothetical protein